MPVQLYNANQVVISDINSIIYPRPLRLTLSQMLKATTKSSTKLSKLKSKQKKVQHFEQKNVATFDSTQTRQFSSHNRRGLDLSFGVDLLTSPPPPPPPPQSSPADTNDNFQQRRHDGRSGNRGGAGRMDNNDRQSNFDAKKSNFNPNNQNFQQKKTNNNNNIFQSDDESFFSNKSPHTNRDINSSSPNAPNSRFSNSNNNSFGNNTRSFRDNGNSGGFNHSNGSNSNNDGYNRDNGNSGGYNGYNRDNNNNQRNYQNNTQNSFNRHNNNNNQYPRDNNTQNGYQNNGIVRLSNFHTETQEEIQEFKTKQQNLFERNPKHALPSQWKTLRDSKAEGKYVTPNLPVPIVGEAVYGSHAVYSALVNQKRKLNHMYILASIAHDVKRAVRPDNFLDKDVVKNQKNGPNSSQSNNNNNNNNNNDSDNDSLFDSSFLIDSSSTKVKSILTNFQSDLDDDLTHIHDEGQIDSLGKYVSPHHIESTREQLTAIYELAQTIPNLKITPLKRDKLDLLAANRPHNGIILDAQPLIPVKTDALTQDHFFVSNKFQPKLKTAEINTKSSKQIQSDSKKQPQAENNTENTKPAVYFALESIFDPNNLGAILRSSTFFGIDGLILPHNSCPLSPAVAKVSSGALDFMNIIQCSNLDNFLTKSLANSRYTSAECKQSYMDITRDNNTGLVRNFDKLCIVGLGLTDEVHSVSGADIFNFVNTIVQNDKSTTKDPFSILVIAGNEGFGLSPQIAAKCHLLLKIPSFQQFPTHFNNIKIKPVVDSLNVSNAVAIALNDVIASKQKLNM